MKAIIIGATGLVGSYLYRAAQAVFDDVVGTYNTADMDDCSKLVHLDITDKDEVANFFKPYIDSSDDRSKDLTICYLTAALTNVDKCEQDQQLSHKVNVEGTINVANYCAKAAMRLVFISSAYVFDGRQENYNSELVKDMTEKTQESWVYPPKPNGVDLEDRADNDALIDAINSLVKDTKGYIPTDAVDPINIYGMHKVQAEHIVLASAASNLVIRTMWVWGYDKNKKCFIYRILNSPSKQGYMPYNDDEIGNPTYAGYLAKKIIQASLIIFNKNAQILHIVGPTSMSRYEWAVEIDQELNHGLFKDYIKPQAMTHIEGKAPRPQDVTLTNSIKGTYNLYDYYYEVMEYHRKEQL